MITSRPKKRDPSLTISVEAVLAAPKGEWERLLIDVRARRDFEKVRIPGSINMDLFALRTKEFLKVRPVVLVNEGYRYASIEEEVRRLRASGFSVTILDGGLAYWRHKKGPLDGDAFAQKELNRVPAKVYFEEKDYDHWVVVDATHHAGEWGQRIFPASISLAVPADLKGLVLQIQAVVAERKIKTLPLVLIFDDRGESYDRTDRFLSSSVLPPVYFLEGGINGYRCFLEQQAILLHSSGSFKKGAERCVSCP